MSWVEDTIREFGAGIGMEDLRLSAEGLVSLDIEAMGTLFIEQTEEDMLVYLVRQFPEYETDIYAGALAACHFSEALPFAIHAALHDENRLVFIARMSRKEFSLPILEQVIDLLNRMHDNIAEGSA